MTEKVKEEKNIIGYILKALKEIPMVVISIIIAHQLDNWNEQRHLRHEEHQILNDIMVELREDSLQLATVLDWQMIKSEHLGEVLHLLKTQNYDQFSRIDSFYSQAISRNPTFALSIIDRNHRKAKWVYPGLLIVYLIIEIPIFFNLTGQGWWQAFANWFGSF